MAEAGQGGTEREYWPELLRARGLPPTNANASALAAAIGRGDVVGATPTLDRPAPGNAPAPQRNRPLPIPPIPPSTPTNQGQTSAPPVPSADAAGADWTSLIAGAAAAGIPLASYLTNRFAGRNAPAPEVSGAQPLLEGPVAQRLLQGSGAQQRIAAPMEQMRLPAPDSQVGIEGPVARGLITGAGRSPVIDLPPLDPNLVGRGQGATMGDPLTGVTAPRADIGAGNPTGPSSVIPEKVMEEAIAPHPSIKEQAIRSRVGTRGARAGRGRARIVE